MSWGKDPSKWGKPITARMMPHQLEQLDLVVKRRNEGRNTWEKLWTRSSVILDLVAAAAVQDNGKQLVVDLLEPKPARSSAALRRTPRGPTRKARKDMWGWKPTNRAERAAVAKLGRKKPTKKKSAEKRRPKAKRSSGKRK